MQIFQGLPIASVQGHSVLDVDAVACRVLLHRLHIVLQDIMGRIDETFPKHMNQEDQGTFVLGYYHQLQKRYPKKEDKTNG